MIIKVKLFILISLSSYKELVMMLNWWLPTDSYITQNYTKREQDLGSSPFVSNAYDEENMEQLEDPCIINLPGTHYQWHF